MGRGKIPQAVLKQLGRRLAGKPLRDANRLLARHLTADSRIWRQVSEHIARHYSDDAGRAAAGLSHGVFDKAYRSHERLTSLLLEACAKPSRAPYFSTWDGMPRVILEKEFKSVIGKAGKGGESTNVLRIVIDYTGRPVTAFPIPKAQLGAAGGRTAGVVATAAAAGGAGVGYAAEAVQVAYAEEIDAQRLQYENAVFDRTGGYAGVAVDVLLDVISLGLLGASATGLDPHEVATRGEVEGRAAQVVGRVEQLLGEPLDAHTRRQVRDDVLAIWGYPPVGDAPVRQDPPPRKVRVHQVKAGETLSAIAQKYYGRADDWRRVYAANFSQIGPNPNLVRVGVKLVIPA